MTEICCIGHITLDEIRTPESVKHMPGGTSWYFSNAINHLPIQYELITAVAETEQEFVKILVAAGIHITCYSSTHTINFVNTYAHNQDYRLQKVRKKADSFTIEQLLQASAKVVHLGPLVSDDIPPDLIPVLAAKTKISLDVQGYLRSVDGEDVIAVRWEEANSILPSVYYLKANEYEMEVLTGCTDIYEGAKALANKGVSEVVITLGSNGSIVLNNNVFYIIPAYKPSAVVDATGCGDTYMAGYLYKRIKGAGIQEAGEFAAAMATINIAHSGPFAGEEEDVYAVINAKNYL